MSSTLWSLGLNAAQVIYDGGRLRALSANAQSAYDATVANYRRVVLTAMQEAEDGIIGRRVLELASARYEGGVASSLDVIVAQQALLNSERLAAQLLGQRMLASVFLVKALGGDWQGLGATRTGQADPAGLTPGSTGSDTPPPQTQAK